MVCPKCQRSMSDYPQYKKYVCHYCDDYETHYQTKTTGDIMSNGIYQQDCDCSDCQTQTLEDLKTQLAEARTEIKRLEFGWKKCSEWEKKRLVQLAEANELILNWGLFPKDGGFELRPKSAELYLKKYKLI